MALRVVPRHEQAWPNSQEAATINNDAVVPRGESSPPILPDAVIEPTPGCVRTKKFRLGLLLCFAVLVVIGIVVGAVVGTRKGRVSSASGDNAVAGNDTTSPTQNGEFDIGGPCFIGGVLLDCAKDLPMTIPDCVVDSYNQYRKNWIPIHDPTFDYEISSCAPANLGLIVTAAQGVENNVTDVEKYVLTNLFMSLNGRAWTNNSNWLSSLDLDQWTGLELDITSGAIVGITLFSNLLDGTLPSQLGLLPSISSLRLEGNDIAGTIPWQYGALKTLRLPYNRLTGTIPVEWGDEDYIALVNLSLNQNLLSGPVPHMPQLEELALDRNFLTGSITLGTNLRDLGLGQNQFEGSIQADLGTSLVTLGLDDIPWDNALSLESLFSRSTDLRVLELGNSRLTGTIPTEIGNCHNLTLFDMGSNQLTGVLPTELGLLTHLENAVLEGNALNGTLPPDLGNLDALETLDMRLNQLTGLLPTELGLLTNLEVAFLGRNALNGTIPSELGNMTALEILDVANNQLTGLLPTEMGLLTNLTSVYLNRNALNGTIPSELGNMDALKILEMMRNDLTGTLPTELGLLTNLRVLFVVRNELSGIIPNEVCSLWDTGWLTAFGGDVCGRVDGKCRSDCYGGASCPSQECCRNCPGIQIRPPQSP